jgi:dienelactone hydrolase
MKEKIISHLKNIKKFLWEPFEDRYPLKPVMFLSWILSLSLLIVYEIYMFQERGIQALGLIVTLSILLLTLGFYFLSLLLHSLKSIPVSVWMFIGPVILINLFIFTSSKSPIGSNIVATSISIMIALFAYYVYSFYFILKNRRKLLTDKPSKALIHILTLMSFFMAYYIFFSQGLDTKLYENAFESFQVEETIKESKESYSVIEGVYGSEDYINQYGNSDSVESISSNISYFVSSFDESKASFLGFNVQNVPLNAHYYLPEGKGPFPVVLMVHGNHEMVKSSETGYGYLGRYLAKRGYAVFSIDQNFLNYSFFDVEFKKDSLRGENDARGFLLLEHIRYLSEGFDINPDLESKLDFNHIGLMGHSRGGEAVAIAEFFNHVNHLPSYGNKKLNRNYNIEAIVAIAPTDGQYNPGGRPTEISNVNYLLLHGTHDMDVTYLAGSNQYERVILDESPFFKSQVLIYGANHGHFNENWQKGDTSIFAGLLHNTKALIDRKDQEAIASQLIYYFLEASLKKNNDYQAGFKNLKTFEDLPKTLYMTQYNSYKDLVLVDYSEDNYLETTSYEGGRIYVSGLKRWYEGKSKLDGRTSDIYGVYLEGNGLRSGQYTMDFIKKPIDVSDKKALYITLSDHTKGSKTLYDFEIILEDDFGNESLVALSQYGLLQHYLDIRLSKFEFLDHKSSEESMFQTFELSFDDFVLDDFNLEALRKVTLRFPQDETRKIFIREIGIR